MRTTTRRSIPAYAAFAGVLVLLLLVALSVPAAAVTVGHFTLVYGGVSYDFNAGTSTFTYTLSWDGQSPALSHLHMTLCEPSTVVTSNPTYDLLGPDGSTGLPYGIKWNRNILLGDPDNSIQVSFTLQGLYATGNVQFAAKAGADKNIGTITGPVCGSITATPTNTAVVEPLRVTKTVNTTFTRTHNWTISKSATPNTWNLLRGDSGTTQYTVQVTKGTPTDSAWAVSGNITIYNPSSSAATITGVTDDVGGIAATVQCPGGLPQALAPGGTLVCTYSASLPNGNTRTNTATVTTSGPVAGGAGTAQVTFSTPTTEVNATIHVNDSVQGSLGAFSSSGQVQYTRTFTCDQDSGGHNNTATIVETAQTSNASVTVTCYALSVHKSAQTRYTRTHNWSITKNASVTTWNLFRGDSATSQYTIDITKLGYTDSGWTVSGSVFVYNGTPLGARITSVSDVVSGVGAANVVCPVTFPSIIPAGQGLECTYSLALPNGDFRWNTGTVTVQNYAFGSAGGATPTGATDYSGGTGVWFGAPAVETNPTIHATDSVQGALGEFTASGQVQYSRTFTCDRDEGVYSNTAAIIETGQSANVDVTVNCYALNVSKTANPTYTRTHTWSIGKSVSTAQWNLFRGESGTSNYTVQVTKVSVIDSAWAVNGTITIQNPAPVGARINNLADVVSGVGAATLNCGVSFPYTLPGGQSLQCSYSLALPNTNSRTNTATASMQNYVYDSSGQGTANGTTDYTGSANVTFGAPTTEINPAVHVTDSLQGALGEFTTSGQVQYSRTFTCDRDEGAYPNTATIVETGQNAQASVTVNCYELVVSKTAVGAFTRTHNWSIGKTATPAVWNLFRGDSAASQYSVQVTKLGYSDGGWQVTGNIYIYNGSPIPAVIANVQDVVSGVGAASVSCGVSLPHSIPAGQGLTCSYSLALPNADHRTNTATVTMQSGAQFSGSTPVVFEEPTTEVNKNVTVTDTNSAFGGPYQVNDSAQWQYTRTFACDRDEGSYPNTATIVETGQTANANVTVNCSALNVSKTAQATYTRTYHWTITKTASPAVWNLFRGDSGTTQYTVGVQKTGYTDSAWAVNGTITIQNPATVGAMINTVADVVSGVGAASVVCPVSFPYTLPGGQSLQCTYSLALPDATSRTNTATASLQNYTYNSAGQGTASGTTDFTGSAAVAFGAPTTEVNAAVHVTDSVQGALGEFTASGQVQYNRTFTCDQDGGVHANTATIVETQQTAHASVAVTCSALNVSKTAQTTYTRTYHWTITKTASPAVWNLFRGDSGTTQYTVGVQKTGYTDSAWAVNGTITIQNPATVGAMINTVADVVSGVGAASVVCPVSFPYTLPGGQSLQCTYSLALPDATSRTNTATAALQNYAYNSAGQGTASGTTDFTGSAAVTFGAPTTEVNADVHVTDSVQGALGEFTASGQVQYSRTFTCDRDQGAYPNTATIVETQQTSSATVALNCYALDVSKTARTTYTRTYHWTISKTASPTTWNLFRGDAGVTHYTVVAQKTGYTDSAWAVNGTITIQNPAPAAATINTVSDVVSGVGAAAVNCGVSFPYELGAGQTLQCSYSKNLPDATSRVNTATATLQNYNRASTGQGTTAGTTDFSGTADVAFGAPTTEVNKQVTVTDTNTAFGGPYVVSDTKDWMYTRTFTCDQDAGAHQNTATIVETGQTASASVTVNCYALTVSKTSETFLTRTYGWTISKSAAQKLFTIYTTQSATTQYTVTLTKDQGADSNWIVAGKITVQNPSPMAATLTDVLDVVSDGINAQVFCHSGLTVPANGSLDCIYFADLPNANNRTNTATVKQQTYSYDEGHGTETGKTTYTASTGVSFGNATITLVNDTVQVTDTYAGSGAPWVFNSSGSKQYNRTFTCDQDRGQHNNTATIVQTGQMAQESVLVNCLPIGVAQCTAVHADNRTPQVNQVVNIQGRAQAGMGPLAVVAYKFNYGDGQETAWIPVVNWQGDVWTTHMYQHPGAYQLNFTVKLANGEQRGGAGTRCGLPIEVRLTPPPTIVVPPPVCGQQPLVTIMNIIDTGRRLQMTGLSRDNAIVDIHIKGPNDADFVANGRTTADAFGQWTYTSSVLGQDGTYQVRALSGGQLSDNTVVYTLRSGPSVLRTVILRAGLSGYTGVQDTYISQQTPLLSFSTGVTMSVRSGTAMESLARFDLSNIPANARVVMAKVGLYSLDAEPCTNMAVPVYQVRTPWTAATTNWISATVGNDWGAPGGRSATEDRVEPATYTQTVRAPFTWYDWDVTPMVRQWVSNPSSNYGLIADTALGGQAVKSAINNLDQPSVTLTMEDLVNALGGRRDFASSEFQELRRRPILFVTYVIP